ncbi:hypothetical protein D3C71_2203090 [compost metagenome]
MVAGVVVAGAVVAGAAIGLPVLSSGRLMIVVLIEDDGVLVTTVVPATGAGPLERPSKRIACPGRMV